MFENIRADIRLARKANAEPGWWGQHIAIVFDMGTLAVVSYRFCHWAAKVRIPVLRQLMVIPAIICARVSELLTGVNISSHAEIGPGLVVHTTGGIHVGPTKIGANCLIQTGVVISYGTGPIGDNVFFGPGAKVIESRSIGSNVVIGANSVVIDDIPDNSTVVGVPARIRFPRTRRLWFERTPSTEDNADASKA